ncbi:MAG TPA: hypothetical protein VGD71_34070 [Kribbella sp.]
MHAQTQRWEPPRLYSWDVQAPRGGTSATGVTDDPDRAMAHLKDELEGAPDGASGVVRRAMPGPSGSYDYGCLLATGHVGPETHTIAWWKRPGLSERERVGAR